jgi:hypothetical protein
VGGQNIKETVHRRAALFFGLTWRAALSPRVARDLLGLAWAMRTRDWWRRFPVLPLPPPEYLRWRMLTAYGDEDALPSVREVLRYARWRRELLRT